MKFLLPFLFCLPVFASIKVENVEIKVIEKNEEPVIVKLPFWVVKAGSNLTDAVKVNDKTVSMKQILSAIETAPKAGPIMTVIEKDKKVIISVE